MPIPDCIKSGSTQEREYLNAWMEMMEMKFTALQAGFTLEKKHIEGWQGGLQPQYHLNVLSGAGGGTAVWQPINTLVVSAPKGYSPSAAENAKFSALESQMAKIVKEEKEKIAAEKDKNDVENEDYLLDLTEEHIRNPAKKMAYGPLVTKALTERIDAYHKEIRAVLSKKFRPSPSSSPSVASGGGSETADPRT